MAGQEWGKTQDVLGGSRSEESGETSKMPIFVGSSMNRKRGSTCWNRAEAEEEEEVRAHCHDLRRAYALSTGENAGEAEVGGDSP